jgi:hypothetical protein
MIWEMCERFGWTLEYVRGMSIADLNEWQTIAEARHAGMNERNRRQGFLSGKGK